jgi:Tfp pilus assembly protein PilO
VFAYLPVRKKQVLVSAQQQELEGKLARYQRLAPQIPLWQARRTELEKSVGRLVNSLYTPSAAQSFLADLKVLSQKEGLKVLDARPTFFELLSAVRDLDSAGVNLVRPVSFSLKVEGGYATIAALAQKIEALPAFRGYFLTEAVRGSGAGRVEATLVFYVYLIINPKAEV